MRLFVGIDLPSVVDDHLGLVRGGIPGARWLDRDQLHLTLRFIGEVDGGTKRRIEDALAGVRHEPFTVTVAGVGHFPPSGQPKVLWAGVDDPAPLRELHGRIERALVAIGLPPEPRKYFPHVTLARLRGSPTPKVVAFLQHHALLRTMSFQAEAFLLYSSVLASEGAKYRIEHRYPLH